MSGKGRQGERVMHLCQSLIKYKKNICSCIYRINEDGLANKKYNFL